MFNNPIYESAFKQLEILCELDFNLTQDDVDDIKAFKDEDEKDLTVDVIDLDAEAEEDLDKNNVGKIILQCPCCETVVMKTADEIELPEDCDDDTECFVQVGEQCPVCFSEEGYKIIGQVAPYEEIEVEVTPKDSEDNVDDEDGEMETDFDDAEETDIEADDEEEDFNESLNEATLNANISLGKVANSATNLLIQNKDKLATVANKSELITLINSIFAGHETPWVEQFKDKLNSLSFEQGLLYAYNSILKGDSKSKKNYIYDSLEEDIEVNQEPDDQVVDMINDKMLNESLTEGNVCPECGKDPCECDKKEESLTEGINDIQLETDHDTISIHAEQKAENGEEMIAPLDFQSANEIVDNQPEAEGENDYLDNVDVAGEELPLEGEEVSPEGNELELENPIEGDTELPIEDFDEDSFNKMGESYLRSVYDNVKTYITESVREADDKDKLVVEGIITFNTGNTKKTQFILEGDKIDTNGNCTILAENLQITPGVKGFTISGKLTEGKFITESLDYNYTQNNTEIKGSIKLNS